MTLSKERVEALLIEAATGSLWSEAEQRDLASTCLALYEREERLRTELAEEREVKEYNQRLAAKYRERYEQARAALTEAPEGEDTV